MATIDYSSGSRIVTEGTHTVYSKTTWGGTWAEEKNLKCLECQWNAAPQMNTAILRWDLGSVILPGDSAATVFGTWIARGAFIRVDWVCDDSSLLRWVGFVDSSDWPDEAFGAQTLVCFGLEQALAKTPMDSIVWRRDPGGGGTVVGQRSAFPITFGSKGGMRSSQPVTGGGDDYVFAAHDDPDPQPWSSRDIVRYLMKWHLPTNSYGVTAVPWALDQPTQIPDWDQVELETENRTVYDLLSEVLSPQKQLGFTVGSDGSTAYLRAYTHLASTLTIGAHSLLANPNQHTLIFAPDALTTARFRDMGGGYDQLLVRGARRKSIMTLEFDGSTGQLEDDFTATLATEYDTAATGETGYSAADDTEKIQRNKAVRGKKKLQTVYSRYRLKEDWNFEISTEQVFPGNDYPHTIQIENRLPVIPGLDWSGTINTDNFDRDGEGIPIQLFWEDPDDATRMINNSAADILDATVGDKIDFDFSVAVTSPEPRKLDLDVTGGPQHVIALNQFTALSGDPTVDVDPQLETKKAKVTLAITEDRYCQGIYPATAPSADIVRRLVVDVGDAYQQVYVVPGTVVDVFTFDGTEETSTGGYLVDDSATIDALAEVIAKSLLLTRKSVSWSSTRKISSIAVGDLITTAGGATVGAPIEAIHIKAPVGVGKPAKPTMQSFEVYRGKLDPIGLLKRLGGNVEDLSIQSPQPKSRPKRQSFAQRRRAAIAGGTYGGASS